MKQTFSIALMLLFQFLSFSQTTIYSEDFTGQAGKGAIGPGGSSPTIDLTDVTWSVNVDDVNLQNTNDWFQVVNVAGSERLEGRDLDGEAIWFSPSIDISTYTSVDFSMDISENGGLGNDTLENGDTVTIEYRIDGGAWTEASTNGSVSNDYDPFVASQTGLSGSTLELRVRMENGSGNERQRLDNIEVVGFAPCTTFSLPFSEDFESGFFPPNCWTSFRGTNDLGSTNDWTSSTTFANSGTTSAFVEFEAVTGGNAEDWLVTPAIDLGTNPTQLRFFGREQFSFDYGTEYTVRISQTSATDISSFTVLETYDETQMGIVFNEKVIDLSAYSGVVYIAFVMEQNDGDNWYIDDVSIAELPNCSTPDNVTNLTANYIDGSVDLQWALGTCYDEVLIVAKDGSAVTVVPTGDGVSYIGNASFGFGTEIVTDEYVVFKGIDNNTTVTNIGIGSTYHFTIFTRKGTNWSSGTSISINTDYCSVTGDTTFETSITLVNFGSINNATGQGSGYDDFTAQSTSMTRGASEDLTVNLNTDGAFETFCFVWIDWNRDGDFDDANEAYNLGSTFDDDGPSSNSPLTITVPNDADLGDTRMRVHSEYFAPGFEQVAGPCEGSGDGEIEDYTITILPSTAYTYNNGWLPSDPNGVSTLANDIVIEAGNATITANTDCNSITVNAGAGLTVNSGVTLNTGSRMILESTSTSYSSLILDGTIVGDVEYKRHVNIAAGSGTGTANNDLLSPPLTGQNFGSFRAANPNILSGTIGGNQAFLFGPFDNNSEEFVNYTPSNDASTLTAGVGYRTGSTNNSTYTFTGTVETGTVSVPVDASANNDWYLIGNPYPSYLKVQDFLNDLINSGLINESAIGIYGYDGTFADGWTIYNLATISASTIITPGQGFFIQAENSGNITFTPSMRTTGTDDDFIVGRSGAPVYLKLNASSNNSNYSTDFYFNENASLSLDPGYDATIWNETPPSFALYSHLVENNTGSALALQALHSDDLSNIVIPLGVNANANETLTFDILESTLPNTVNVYLEDTQTNTFTLLTEEAYQVIPSEALNGTGRFFLRFEEDALSLVEGELETLNIYTNHIENTIVVNGLLSEATSFKLYDLQGRMVVESDLRTQTMTQSINVSTLDDGIYIVELTSTTKRKTQKVILR
ncbi:choice-of-anchor J domain-containing protein [Winogradskyella sp. 3972H.M.0a.05]|uniref:T9SS-dependent choice-of-anchor J family protein n=1 Tax=Winogradskyella sp. 3972H.M.0a.05 TaxID=2950277 RepID=UPI00339A4D52